MMKMKSTASSAGTCQNNTHPPHTTYQCNNSSNNSAGGGSRGGGEGMRRVAPPPLRSLLLTVGVAGLLLAAAVLLFALVLTPSHFTLSSSSPFSSSSSFSSTLNDAPPSTTAEPANPSSFYTDSPQSSAQVAVPAAEGKYFAPVESGGGASKNIEKIYGGGGVSPPGRTAYDISSSRATTTAAAKQDTPVTEAPATLAAKTATNEDNNNNARTVGKEEKEEEEEEVDRHHYPFIGAARTLASVTTRNAIATVEHRTKSSGASSFSSSSIASLASASAASIAALKALLDPRDDAALVAAHLNHRYYRQQQQLQQQVELRDGRRKSTATGHDISNVSKVAVSSVSSPPPPLPLPLPLVWLPHLAPQHIAALAYSPVVPTFWSHYHNQHHYQHYSSGVHDPLASSRPSASTHDETTASSLQKPPSSASRPLLLSPPLSPSPLRAQLCEVLYQPLCHFIDRTLQSASSPLLLRTSRQRGIISRRRRREILREAFVPGYLSIDPNDDKKYYLAAANSTPSSRNPKNESDSDATSHSGGGGRGDDEEAAEIAMTILSFPPPPNPQRLEGSDKDGEATATTTTNTMSSSGGSSVPNTDHSTSTRAAGPVTTRWVKVVAAGLGTSSTSSSSSFPLKYYRHQQRPPCAAVARLEVRSIGGDDSDKEERDQHDAHRTFIARLRADADYYGRSSSRSEGATTIAAAVARRVVREGLLLGRCQTHLQQSEQQRKSGLSSVASNDDRHYENSDAIIIDNLLPLSLLPLVTPAVEFSLWPFFEHVSWRASVIIQSEIHHHQRDEEEAVVEQQGKQEKEKEVEEAVPVGGEKEKKEEDPARRRRTSSGSSSKRSKKRFSPALVQRARITLMRAEGRAIAAASDLLCDPICLHLRHHRHHHNDHHNKNHKKRNHHNTDTSGDASSSSSNASSNVLLSSLWRCGGYTLEKRVIGSDRDPTLRCRFFFSSSSLSSAAAAGAHHRHHHNDHPSSFPHSSKYPSSNNDSKIYSDGDDVDVADVEGADAPLQMAFAWPAVLVPDYGSCGARVTSRSIKFTSSSGALNHSTIASPPHDHQQHTHVAVNRIGNDFVIIGSKLVIGETGEGGGDDDDGGAAAVETSSMKDAATMQASTPLLLPFESSLNYYLRTSAASSRQQQRQQRRRKSFPSSSSSTGSDHAGDAVVPFSVAHRRDLRDSVLFAMIASNQMAPRRVVPALQTWLRHWDTVVFFEDAYADSSATTATSTSETSTSNDTKSSSMSGEGGTRRRLSRGDGALWLPLRHLVNDDSSNQQKQRKVEGNDHDHDDDDDDANRREKEDDADRGGTNNKRARGIVSRRLASLLRRVDLHALGDVGPITAPPISTSNNNMNDDIPQQQHQHHKGERARLARLLGDAVGVAVPTATIGSTTINAPSVVLEVSTGHRLLLGDARPITRLEEVMTEEEDGEMKRNGNDKRAPKSGATTSSSSSSSSSSSASALLIRHLQTLRRPQRIRNRDHDHHHAAGSATNNNNNNNNRHISDEHNREQSTSDLSFYGHITDQHTKHRTMMMKRRRQEKGGSSMIPDICRDLVPPPSLIADNNDKDNNDQRNDDDDSGARTGSTTIKKDPPEEVTPPPLLLRSRARHAVVGFVRPLWLPEPNPASASHGLGGAWKNFPMLFAMLADELQRHAALAMMAAATTSPTTTTATIGTARISAAAAGGGLIGGLRQYYVIIDDDTYYLHRNLLIYMTYFLPFSASTTAAKGVNSRTTTTPPVLEKGGKQSTSTRATTTTSTDAPGSMESWMGMAIARVLAQAQRAAPPPMLLGRLVYNRSNSEGSSSLPSASEQATTANPNSSESTTTVAATTTPIPSPTTRKEADDEREQQQQGDERTTTATRSSSSSSSSKTPQQLQPEDEEQHDLVCENNILVNDWLHSGGDSGKNRKFTKDPRISIHHSSSSSNGRPPLQTPRPPPPRCFGHRAIHGGSGVWVNAPALLQLMMRSLLAVEPSMAEEGRGRGGKVNPTNNASSPSSSSFENALVLNGLCQQPSVFGRSVYGDVWVGLCADMMIPKTPEPEKDDEKEGTKIKTRRRRTTTTRVGDTKKGNLYDIITNAQRRPKGRRQHKEEEGEEEEQQWALRQLLEPVPMVPNPFLSELSPFAVLHIRRRHQAQHLLDVSNSRAAQIPSVWPYYTHIHNRDTHNRKQDRSIHSGSEHQHNSPQEAVDLPTSSRFQSGNTSSSTYLPNFQITAVATSAQLFATTTTSATTARRLQQHLRPIRLEGRHHHAFKEVGGLFPVAFHQIREADDFWHLAALEYRYEGLLAAQQLQQNEENSNKNKNNNTQMFQDVDEGSALRWVDAPPNNNYEEGSARHHGGGEHNDADAADGLLPSNSSSSSSSSNVSIRINDPMAVDYDALVLLTGHLPLSWSRLATIPPTAARECGSYLFKHYLTVYRPQYQQLVQRQFLIQKKKREARWPQQQQGEGAAGLSHLLQQLQSPQKDVPIEAAELRSPPPQPLTFPQWILLPHRRSSSSSPLDIFSSGGRCGAAALEHLGEQLEMANALLNES